MWPYLLLAAAGIGWGFGFPTGKVALRELPWHHLIALRLGMAGLIVLPYALVSAEARKILLTDRWIWLAGLFNGLAYLISYAGLAQLTVSLSAVLVGLLPALIALGSVLWGERVTGRRWVGVAAATAGAVVIGAGAGPSGGSMTGIALSVTSLLVFVAYVWALKHVTSTRDVLAGPVAVMTITGAVVALLAIALYGVPPLRLHTATWAALVGAALGSTVLASGAWQIASLRAPTASAGVFLNLEPLVGAAIGVSVFGDLTATLLIGGALILTGSLIIILSGSKTETLLEPA